MVAYGAADILDYAPVAKKFRRRRDVGMEMCKAIVELSDNTCANLLLARSAGRADRVPARDRRYGFAARP